MTVRPVGALVVALLVSLVVGANLAAAVDEAPVGVVLLADPDGQTPYTQGELVNERGQVAGYVDNRVAVWDPDQTPVLAPEVVPPNAPILAFADDGTVLVNSDDANGPSATWWNHTTGRLETVAVGGQALAGNDAGALVVTGGGSTWLRSPEGVITPIVDQHALRATMTSTGWVLLRAGADANAPGAVLRWSEATGLESGPAAGYPSDIADDGTVVVAVQASEVAPDVVRWDVDGTTSSLFGFTVFHTVEELAIGPTGTISGRVRSFESEAGSLQSRIDAFVWTADGGLEAIVTIFPQSWWDRYIGVTAPNSLDQVAAGAFGRGVLWSPDSTRPFDAPNAFPGDLSDRGQVTGAVRGEPYSSDTRPERGFLTGVDEPVPASTTTTVSAPPARPSAAPTNAAPVTPRFAG